MLYETRKVIFKRLNRTGIFINFEHCKYLKIITLVLLLNQIRFRRGKK